MALRIRGSTKDRIDNLANMLGIIGCIIVLAMSISISVLLLADFTNSQPILVNPYVYGLSAIGWILVLLGLGKLGLGWKLSFLERHLSGVGYGTCENCGCISGIPIVFGLIIGLLYQVVPVGIPLDYFLPLPLLASIGMVLLGFTFIIYKDRMQSSTFVSYVGILFIGIGAGTSGILFSGLIPISALSIAWLLIASGPIFMLPLIWIFYSQQVIIPQQP